MYDASQLDSSLDVSHPIAKLRLHQGKASSYPPHMIKNLYFYVLDTAKSKWAKPSVQNPTRYASTNILGWR